MFRRPWYESTPISLGGYSNTFPDWPSSIGKSPMFLSISFILHHRNRLWPHFWGVSGSPQAKLDAQFVQDRIRRAPGQSSENAPRIGGIHIPQLCGQKRLCGNSCVTRYRALKVTRGKAYCKSAGFDMDHGLGARKFRISPIASARPQRLTGAFSGKAVSSRLGVAPSRITKQPLSCGPRISRPKACFSRKRVIRSSWPLPNLIRLALWRMVGLGQADQIRQGP